MITWPISNPSDLRPVTPVPATELPEELPYTTLLGDTELSKAWAPSEDAQIASSEYTKKSPVNDPVSGANASSRRYHLQHTRKQRETQAPAHKCAPDKWQQLSSEKITRHNASVTRVLHRFLLLHTLSILDLYWSNYLSAHCRSTPLTLKERLYKFFEDKISLLNHSIKGRVPPAAKICCSILSNSSNLVFTRLNSFFTCTSAC